VFTGLDKAGDLVATHLVAAAPFVMVDLLAIDPNGQLLVGTDPQTNRIRCRHGKVSESVGGLLHGIVEVRIEINLVEAELARPVLVYIFPVAHTIRCIGKRRNGMALQVHVEVEEQIDTYEPADNGAGPLWCHGCSVIARRQDEVFAVGLETLAGEVPLNNTRWVLYHRRDDGEWKVIHRDDGRTREPSPIALLTDDLLVSANPTQAASGKYGGAAEPVVFRFDTTDLEHEPTSQQPDWVGDPSFRDHSYRTFIGDATTGQALYMQNEGYDVAHLSFLNAGQWHGRGVIRWPFGDGYAKPQPLRLCYPNVQLRDGVAHFLGVGDIVEPVDAWREAKKKITGRDWDYVFRRLFYSRSQPLTQQANDPFGSWLELANRDETAGATRNCDLWVDPQERAHLMWIEITTDHRIRDEFFPGVEIRHSLEYAIIVDERVEHRRTLATLGEEEEGPTPHLARFHEITPGHAVIVAQFSTDQGPEYRLGELPGHTESLAEEMTWAPIPFARPMSGTFLTNTVRGGSNPSTTLDLVGSIDGPALGYARVRIEAT